MIRASMRAFLHGLVDYAGLFPPAKLDMVSAVSAYAKHRASPHAFGIARFVCPVTRLDEFGKAAAPHLPDISASVTAPSAGQARAKASLGRGGATAVVVKPLKITKGSGAGAAAHDSHGNANGQGNGATRHAPPWALSVLVDKPLSESLELIERFNQAHHKNHHSSAVIDTVEIKVVTPDAIDYALEHLSEDLFPWFEIPPASDMRTFAAELEGTGAGAKMRTGGITPDLIPTVEQVADFLIPMAGAHVPVKCTAGLHHPIRSSRALTYEAASPSAVMHGFLNVFLAACILHEMDVARPTVIQLLSETDAASFKFDDAGVSWRGLRIPIERIAEAREDFAHCFGSCSFDDPVNDLKALGML